MKLYHDGQSQCCKYRRVHLDRRCSELTRFFLQMGFSAWQGSAECCSDPSMAKPLRKRDLLLLLAMSALMVLSGSFLKTRPWQDLLRLLQLSCLCQESSLNAVCQDNALEIDEIYAYSRSQSASRSHSKEPETSTRLRESFCAERT